MGCSSRPRPQAHLCCGERNRPLPQLWGPHHLETLEAAVVSYRELSGRAGSGHRVQGSHPFHIVAVFAKQGGNLSSPAVEGTLGPATTYRLPSSRDLDDPHLAPSPEGGHSPSLLWVVPGCQGVILFSRGWSLRPPSCDDSEDVFSHKGTEQAGGVSKCGPLSVTAAPAPGLVKG